MSATLSTKEVAKVLDRSISTIRNWRTAEGVVSPKFVRLGGTFRYDADDLAVYVERLGLAAPGHGADYVAARLAEEDAA